jgi:hypothetical protein
VGAIKNLSSVPRSRAPWPAANRLRRNDICSIGGRVRCGVKALFRTFEQSLSGWPDGILSVSLIASGIVVILVGLFAPRAIKLLVLAWIWFP